MYLRASRIISPAFSTLKIQLKLRIWVQDSRVSRCKLAVNHLHLVRDLVNRISPLLIGGKLSSSEKISQICPLNLSVIYLSYPKLVLFARYFNRYVYFIKLLINMEIIKGRLTL